MLWGLVNLVRPTGKLWVNTRRQAGRLLAISFGVLLLGVILDPASADEEEQLAAPSETTTTAEETTTVASTSTTSSSSTTSTSPTTTTIPLPPIPQANLVFAPLASGPSGDPSAPLESGAEAVTIVSITDGDTVDVRLADGSTDTVRLIGINSPESNECFAAEAGVVLSILAPVGSEVGLTVDVTDRDQFDRLLRYVWVGTMSVNQEMVRRGAAIAREYAPDTAMASALEQAQAAAQQEQLGLWHPTACGPSAGSNVTVVQVEADAPGDDNNNLNQEWVQVQNHDALGVDLTGWVLRDESSSNRYQFPSGFVIAAAPATVFVYTGCGDNSDSALYWCSNGAVWNNEGDTAMLLDQHGNVVHSFAYVPPTTTTTAPPPTTATTSGGGNCHPSYPTVCIPPPPPDLDCGEISFRRFDVTGSDPHGFDGDDDGVGCESG